LGSVIGPSLYGSKSLVGVLIFCCSGKWREIAGNR
jgi:hypothetical protein